MKQVACKVIAMFRSLSEGRYICPSDEPYICDEGAAERLRRAGCVKILGDVEICVPSSIVPPVASAAIDLAGEILCSGDESPEGEDPVGEDSIAEDAAPESPLQDDDRPRRRGRRKKRG